MIRRSSHHRAGIAAALLVTLLSAPVHVAAREPTLARAIPDDVLLFVAGKHNPERAFVTDYWCDVFDAVKDSGIGDDLMGLIGSLLGEDGTAEVTRLRERASQLLAGVNWEQLGGGEVVFAERLPPPIHAFSGRAAIWMPNMVWIFRGSGEGAAENFHGLSAILEALAEEINGAIDSQALVVKRSSRSGATIAEINLLGALPGAPALRLAAAHRGDLVMIALGERLFGDVLGLLEGGQAKRSLAEDPRFKAAFARLPEPEDSLTFFNTQALVNPFREFTDLLMAQIHAPGDVYHNTGMNLKARKFHDQSIAAYRRGDFKEALRSTQQAHAIDSGNSILLYNLSCFSALTGKKEEALTWLEEAVDAGFHAPDKISSDSDLVSLRDEPKYKAALSLAAQLARESQSECVVVNSTKSGESYKLILQARQAAEQENCEQSLLLVQQAYEVAPDDSRVLYNLARFHALLRHDDRALHFLDQAVEKGFYCPEHISGDSDLDRIRETDRYRAALARAKKKAAQETSRRAGDKLALAKGITHRVMNAVGILDYVASVETTDGYSVRMESIAAMVPGAKDRPIYKVFGNRKPLKDFARYLPKETLSFSVSSGVDVKALYSFLENTLLESGPKGEELLAKWSALQVELGLDIKKDIVGWIDGECVSVTLEDDGGWVGLIKVTDEQTARERTAAVIDLLSTKLGQAAQTFPTLGMLMLSRAPAEHDKLVGFESVYLAVSPMTPVVWGVADGRLIVGTSADAIVLCLDTARGEHPNIRDNARIMAEAVLPAGPCSSVKLSDRRNFGNDLATILGVVSMAGGSAGMFMPNEEVRSVIMRITGIVSKLMPAAQKIDFYKSTAACTTFDGRAWRIRQVTHYLSPTERADKNAKPQDSPPQATEGL